MTGFTGFHAGRREREHQDLHAAHAELWRVQSAEFAHRTQGAFGAAPDWRRGLRALGWEACRYLQEDPERACLLVALTYADEIVAAGRDHLMDEYVEILHRGRFERPEAADVPRFRAEAIVGAVWETLASRVTAGAFHELPHGVPQLLYLAVLPYLGPEAAEEELRRGREDLERYRRGLL